MEPSAKTSVAFVNHFFPGDAKLLRSLYRQCGEMSQRTGWRHVHESVFGARALAFCTIPLAALNTLNYAARGVLQGGVEVLNGDVPKALSVARKDAYSSLQCLALVIAGIAYAVLGLFVGSILFRHLIPEPAAPSLDERFSDQNAQLNMLKQDRDKLADEIQALRQSQETLNNEKAQALQKLETADLALDHIAKKWNDLNEEKKDLNDLSDKKNAVMKTLRQRHLELNANFADLQKKYEDLKREAASKEIELETQLTFKIACLEEKNQTIQKMLKELNESRKASVPSQTLSLKPEEPCELERSFCLMDSSDDTVEASSWFKTVANIGATCFNMAAFLPTLTVREIIKAIQKGIKKTSTTFIDKKDPWKAQRYIKSSQTLAQAFGKEAITALKQVGASAKENPAADAIVKNIRMAMNALTIPGLNAKAGKQFDEFQKALCEALILLSKGGHDLDSKITSELNRLSHDFFTKINFLTFYTKLVYYVAVSRKKELAEKLGLDGTQAAPMPLSEKMQLIYQALPQSGSDLTAPTAHVLAAKMGVLFSAFDPLHDSNIPTVLAKKVHTAMDESKPPLETIHFRTGVPIGPKMPGTEKKPWEIADVSFVPEYEALLDHLKANNEKLLVILHLDPKYIDEVAHGGSGPKSKEAVWIRMYVELAKSEKYRDTVELALLPVDGTWLTEELETGVDQHGKSIQKMDDYIDWLTDVATRAKSPFIIPASVGDKRAFIRQVAEATHARYFPKIGGQDMALNTKERRQAFLGFFKGLLAEALQIQTGAKKVQRNCKDAVDRTMSLFGAEMLHDGTVLNQIEEPSFQENLIGTIFGASLANVKRRILEHLRFEIFMNSLKHLEWLKKEGIALGPIPQFNGYQLACLEFPTDPSMSLYAEPSQMLKDSDYVDLLKFEEAHLYTLPSRIPLTNLKGENVPQEQVSKQALQEVLDSLKARYDNPTLMYHLQEEDKVESKELGGQLLLKRKYIIQQEEAKPLGVIHMELKVPLDHQAPPQYSYEVAVC